MGTMRVLRWAVILSALVIASMGPTRSGHAAAEVRVLTWDDLLPPGEEEKLARMYQAFIAGLGSAGPIQEGGPGDSMTQIGTFDTVPALDGQRIRLPGFPVPFDFNAEAEVKEFLLVPYFGACIHTPPPPPNQVVYIKSDKPVKLDNIWDPIWVEGKLSTAKKESEIGDAAYTLALSKAEPYRK